jgi:hypothetical protein
LQSQNATVPVEIKIESDDDDDDDGGGGGNIAEPLVALSLTVNLEDQDVSKGKILLHCNNEQNFLLFPNSYLVL